MFWLSIIVFALMFFGLFYMLNLSPQTIADDINDVLNPQENIRQRALKAQRKKKGSKLIGFLKETQDLMKYMHQGDKFTLVCIISILLSILGVVIAVYIDNVFLIPAFIFGFLSLPFVFVRMYSHSYATRLQHELDPTLTQITTSYLRSNDIVKSIEENTPNIQNKSIRVVFEEFLTQIKYINPNEKQAIEDMKDKINNDIWEEWCDGLRKCADDRNLKYLLTPILEKFSILHSIESKIQNALAEIKMSYMVILGIVFANIPLMKMLNDDWYNVLVNSLQGKICLGVVALISVICTIILVFITKPLKYKV